MPTVAPLVALQSSTAIRLDFLADQEVAEGIAYLVGAHLPSRPGQQVRLAKGRGDRYELRLELPATAAAAAQAIAQRLPAVLAGIARVEALDESGLAFQLLPPLPANVLVLPLPARSPEAHPAGRGVSHHPTRR